MDNNENKYNETNNRFEEHEKEVAASRKEAVETSKRAAKILDDKKAVDVNILKLSDQTVIADCFVIATGTSSTHIKALADEVEFQLQEQLNVKPDHIEGFGNASWILLDYGTVIIHIFTKESRDFYNLERLWSDAEKVDFDIENSNTQSM